MVVDSIAEDLKKKLEAYNPKIAKSRAIMGYLSYEEGKELYVTVKPGKLNSKLKELFTQ